MESLEDRIKKFLSISYGSGSGDGSGSGSGSGDGDGYGYSYGSGSGSGSGDGSGSGSGDGDGYGSGDGSGYGSGDGSGSGSGDGSGYGYSYGSGELKSYNRQKVYYIDDVPTLIDQVRNMVAKGHIINKDKTLTPCYIVRVGDSFAHGETLQKAHNDALAKHMQEAPEEERIEMFVNEHPQIDGLHPCVDLFKWHNILTGSCEMGRTQFCRDHCIDMDKAYSVRFFLNITENAYGGSTIKKVIEKYKSL